MILYCTAEMALALKNLIPIMAREIPPGLDPEVATGLAAVNEIVSSWDGPVLDREALFGRSAAPSPAETAILPRGTELVPELSPAAPAPEETLILSVAASELSPATSPAAPPVDTEMVPPAPETAQEQPPAG